jgi:hypothetical protein
MIQGGAREVYNVSLQHVWVVVVFMSLIIISEQKKSLNDTLSIKWSSTLAKQLKPWRIFSCDLCWREVEASVDGLTLPS